MVNMTINKIILRIILNIYIKLKYINNNHSLNNNINEKNMKKIGLHCNLIE